MLTHRMRAGGNSFNQLAVLATYSDAALPAVYFYYRSLAVAHPFQVARENLLLLFEQNRVHYEQLAGSAGQGTGGGSGGRATAGRGRGRNRDPAQQQQKPRVPIAALLPKLTIRFVRVHGVLPSLKAAHTLSPPGCRANFAHVERGTSKNNLKRVTSGCFEPLRRSCKVSFEVCKVPSRVSAAGADA